MGVRAGLGGLSRLHAFPKPESHLTQKTVSGAVVTLVGVLTASILLIHELSFFLTPTKDYKMSVDATARGGKLPVFFDITFPSLPCQVLELDTVDASGDTEMDIHGASIHKTRLNSQGYRIGSEKMDHTELKKRRQKHGQLKTGAEKAKAGAKGAKAKTAENQNLPALQDKEAQFENPFDAIMSLFNFTGMEDTVKEMEDALDAKEGCRLTGHLDVPRVSGTLHVSIHVRQFYIVQRVFPTSERINMSHFIHTFGFGAQFPGRVNPLDGVTRTIHPLAPGEKEDNNPHHIGTFKYFLKVVPTRYKSLLGRSIETNQFSVSEFFQEVDTKQFGMLPALNFVYDLSPIEVTITEERENFFSFLTRLCAVIGGTFALTGMLNKLVYAGLKQLQQTSKTHRT